MFEIKRPIVVDTETYYKKGQCSVIADPKKDWVGGNWHYVTHPDYYPYMIQWMDLETGARGVLDDRSKFKEFINSTLRDRTIISHNAGFDSAVLWSVDNTFRPWNCFDTSDMASYMQAPRNLEGACKILLSKALDKGMREFMNGKHYAEIGAERQAQMRAYGMEDVIATAELFRLGYNRWPVLEQWVSNFTREQSWDGVYIDQNYLQEQIDKVSAMRARALAGIPWAETDQDKPMSAKKLAVYCREVGILPPASLAEDSPECQEWEARYGDQYPVVGAIRDFRIANTYLKKLRRMELSLRPDGTMPLDTLYAAAPHTLRFSAKGVNYQNLPRSSAICDLRGCFAPRPGHKFITADLAGIEARCLPWLAGDFEFLEALAKLDKAALDAGQSGGGDLYEPHCRKMFGYSDPRPLRKTDKDLRNATKICVLQLGYQSGRKKFDWFITNNVEEAVLDRVRQKGETNAALAARLVALFRGMNPKIQSLWYALDNDLRAACAIGEDMKVQLPNGRVVHYFDLAIRETRDENGASRREVVGAVVKGEELAKLYGGKLTENACQGMARDVLIETLYGLSKAGHKVKFSVHDEDVVEVPEDVATPENARFIEGIMSVTPAWAPGLPLAAETHILDRYAK